jgi:DNA-directed RNA polymerase specialized sigma24 family protein
MCEDVATLESTQYAYMRYAIKCKVDTFVIAYSAWLDKISKQAVDRWRVRRGRQVQDDLKSELILQAYECGKRFKPELGIPIEPFLLRSLQLHSLKPDLMKKYIRNKKEVASSSFDDTTFDDAVQKNFSTSERESVLPFLEGMSERDRLMCILYIQGYTYVEIDAMLGMNRDASRNRILKAIGSVKVIGK